MGLHMIKVYSCLSTIEQNRLAKKGKLGDISIYTYITSFGGAYRLYSITMACARSII